jgi:hypothetical protein
VFYSTSRAGTPETAPRSSVALSTPRSVFGEDPRHRHSPKVFQDRHAWNAEIVDYQLTRILDGNRPNAAAGPTRAAPRRGTAR